MAGNILIVEDSSVMRKIIIRGLEAAGLEFNKIIEVGDGEAALEKLESESVDIMFVDWNMPKMNGLQFVKAARAMDTAKKIPIVMVTTEGAESKMDEAMSAGADAYITKPFVPGELKDRIKHLL